MNEPITYLSVCSGIEAATVAWEPLGWKPLAFAEIEPYPAAVLHQRYGCGRARFMPEPDATDDPDERKARYAAFAQMVNVPLIENPQTPNLGDITQYAKWPDIRPSVLIGGTPCQSFSVAGLREGLRDPRGNLALVYLAIAERYRPRWIVWENVPGVLSSDGGRCFGSFLGGLEKLGYGWAYRTLDAQYFGVAQQRRRVFVVGYAGDWRRAAAALFEPESVRWNSAPRRRTRPQAPARASCDAVGSGVAGTIGRSYEKGHGRTGGANGGVARGHLIPAGETSLCLNAGGMGRQDAETETMVAHVPDVALALSATGFGTCGADDNQAQASHIIAAPLTGAPYADRGAADESKLIVARTLTDMDRGATPRENLIPMPSSLRASNELARKCRALAMLAPTPIRPIPKPVPREPSKVIAFEPRSRGDDGRGDSAPCVAVTLHGSHDRVRTEASPTEIAKAITTSPPGESTNCSTTVAVNRAGVRRLTCRECERLQGFPDDYTLIPWKNRRDDADRAETVDYFMEAGYSRDDAEKLADTPDGPRYKAIGNSMAVPVMRWIGERIAAVDKIKPAPAP